MYLIKQVETYAPQALGKRDILLGGGQILHIAEQITIDGPWCQCIDGAGMIALPGLVDTLVHISGGGGEGGFHTRTPQMTLTDATLAGVTTVIGALGTDATTRTLADLLAKARGLENEGISAYCYTGSYQLPPRTLTGHVTDDIVHVDKLIGIGEVAIADHRSSQPDMQMLAQVAADARVGGMLSGKAGIVSIHVGDAQDKLSLLHQVADRTAIPASQFYPTHINRNQALLDAGVEWARRGGFIDMTTSTNQQFIDEGEIPAARAVAYCLEQGISARQITMSSDGNASLPVFDQNGALVGLEVGKVASLLDSLKVLIQTPGVSMEDAIRTVTQTPADILKLHHKGRLQPGADADLVLLDAAQHKVQHVFARGRHMVSEARPLVTGTFSTA